MVGLSLVSLISYFVRRSFLSADLRHHNIPIDSDTTLSCWLSPSLSHPSNPKTPQKPHPENPKPVLVLIHGFGPSATWQWRGQVGLLARHFDLVVPDLVFFGGSTTQSASRSEAFQAECLRLLLEAIGLISGDGGGGQRRVAVAGTSYGGFVAYHLARSCGKGAVERVVIASSDVLKSEEDDQALADRAGVERVSDLMLPQTTPDLRKLLGLAAYREPKFVPEFFLRDIVKNLFSKNLEQKKELIKGITLGDKDKFQITPLPQDVLIIWGEQDRIFPLEKAFELKKQLGDKARLEILKNTGHMPQLEDQERFNEVLLNFLLEAPKSSA